MKDLYVLRHIGVVFCSRKQCSHFYILPVGGGFCSSLLWAVILSFYSCPMVDIMCNNVSAVLLLLQSGCGVCNYVDLFQKGSHDWQSVGRRDVLVDHRRPFCLRELIYIFLYHAWFSGFIFTEISFTYLADQLIGWPRGQLTHLLCDWLDDCRLADGLLLMSGLTEGLAGRQSGLLASLLIGWLAVWLQQ